MRAMVEAQEPRCRDEAGIRGANRDGYTAATVAAAEEEDEKGAGGARRGVGLEVQCSC